MKTKIILEITKVPSGTSQCFIKNVDIQVMVPVGINFIINNVNMNIFDVTIELPDCNQMLLAHTHCDDDNYEELIDCMLHLGWVIHEMVPHDSWEDVEYE